MIRLRGQLESLPFDGSSITGLFVGIAHILGFPGALGSSSGAIDKVRYPNRFREV